MLNANMVCAVRAFIGSQGGWRIRTVCPGPAVRYVRTPPTLQLRHGFLAAIESRSFIYIHNSELIGSSDSSAVQKNYPGRQGAISPYMQAAAAVL